MKSVQQSLIRCEVPPAFKVMISRLFGSESIKIKEETFTDAQWKSNLNQILKELKNYLLNNIDSDELHMYMIYSGFLAAKEALKQKYFWPAYTEAILRITFLLIGDLPDHRRRKGGRKRLGHYNLKRYRSAHYFQDQNQKLRTLLAVHKFGLPKLEKNPNVALREFRYEFGFSTTYKQFFKWYKEKYGKDYALVF